MNVTILLQGISHPEINLLNTIKEYSKFAKIVISYYPKKELLNFKTMFKNLEIVFVENDEDDFIKELNEKFPEVENSYRKHTYFQIRTTLAGLQKVDTEYVVKTRLDHYYSNIQDLIQLHISTKKIVCSSIFARGIHEYKYHPSDILFCCKRYVMNDIFNICFSNLKSLTDISEVLIWKPYILSKFPEIESYSDSEYIKSMCELFEVFPLNYHKSYKIKLKNFSMRIRKFGLNQYTGEISNYFPLKNKTSIEYFTNGIM